MAILFSSLLFACSVNIDAFFVGLTLGIRKTPIKIISNIIISFISLLGTIFAILLGTVFSNVFPPILSQCLGSSILFAIGFYYLGKIFFKSSDAELVLTPVHTPSLPIPLFLGLMLSMNNIGISIGASISGIHPLFAASLTFFFSILFIQIGNILGLHTSVASDKASDLLSGFVLLLLGLFQLVF